MRVRFLLHWDQPPTDTDQVIWSSSEAKALGAQGWYADSAVIGGEHGRAPQPDSPATAYLRHASATYATAATPSRTTMMITEEPTE